MNESIDGKLLAARSYLIMILLAAGGLVATLMPIPMLLGLDVSFAGLFLLLMLRLFGMKASLAAAIAMAIAGFWHADHSPLAFLSVLEVAFLSVCLRVNRTNLLLCDLKFWLLVGSPILLLTYYGVHDGLHMDALLIVCKAFMNGALNALIADLAWTYLPWSFLMHARRMKSSIPLQQAMFHLAVTAAIIPFLLFMATGGFFQLAVIDGKASQRAEELAYNMRVKLSGLSEHEVRSLNLQAKEETAKLDEEFARMAASDDIVLALLDTERRVVASNRPELAGHPWTITPGSSLYLLQNGLYMRFDGERRQWFESDRWKTSSYIYASGAGNLQEHELRIEVPFSSFFEEVKTMYLTYYASFVAVVFLAAILSNAAASSVTRGLKRLAALTADLPERLRGRETVVWPVSGVEEVGSLIGNFMRMANDLSRKFEESDLLHASLTQQTSKLLESETKLHKLAYNDALTGLPNRLHFTDYLNGLVTSDEGLSGKHGVLFMDIDRFKQVNDTLGHAAGDDLLRVFAERLMSCKDDAVVCRLGGDEFVIVMPHSDRPRMHAMAERVIRLFAEPIRLREQEFYVNSSIGISVYPDDGESPEELVMHADTAMYAAKEAGGCRFEFFSSRLYEPIAERLQLETRLHRAIEFDEFELFYQPKIATDDGRLAGVEALIRWRQPEGGYMPPDRFIPLAEATGLIHALGEWVLREACKQNQAWQEAGYPPIVMAVNVSARQFENPKLVELVSEVLSDSGMGAEWLEIEITESSLQKDQSTVIYMLNRLQEQGVRIAIDDFGTGYSSLSQLKNLPLCAIKIDRVFIRSIDTDSGNAAIVRAITELAHSMGLTVVAEGVETESELACVRLLACDELQGYYYSPPLSAEELERYLQARMAGTRVAGKETGIGGIA
jgi:diguanylate cyclase (GGDEF)-like protein